MMYSTNTMTNAYAMQSASAHQAEAFSACAQPAAIVIILGAIIMASIIILPVVVLVTVLVSFVRLILVRPLEYSRSLQIA